jgi:SNF family Na+-dependent transporter
LTHYARARFAFTASGTSSFRTQGFLASSSKASDQIATIIVLSSVSWQDNEAISGDLANFEDSASDRLLLSGPTEMPRLHCPPTVEQPKKKKWISGRAFQMVALGSVVGFGNIMHFPAHIYESGGAIWILPCAICTIFVGIPMITLETVLGQIVRKNAVDALGLIHPALRWLGYLSITLAFLITCYYAMYVAYAAIYIVESMRDSSSWDYKRDASDPCESNYYAHYFFYQFIGVYDDGCNQVDMETLSVPVAYVVLAVACTFIVVYGCTACGIDRLSKITYVTVLLPLALLVMLMVQLFSLHGAFRGLNAIFGEWDLRSLNNGVKWAETVKEVLFSLSVCCGIFMTYGSYDTSKHSIVGTAAKIGCANFVANLVCAVIVFAPLGHASLKLGTSVEQYIEDYGVRGHDLMFASLPRAMSAMETGTSRFSPFVLYLSFFLLGLQSVIAGLEPLISLLHERYKKRYNRPQICAAVCVVAFGVGCIFSTPQGFYFAVDAFSYFLRTWGLLTIGLAQVVVAGWVVGFKDACDKTTPRSVYVFAATYFAACTLSIIIFFSTGAFFRGGVWKKWYDSNGSGTKLGNDGEDVGYDPHAVGFEALLGTFAWLAVVCVGWGYSFYCSKTNWRVWLNVCVEYGIQDFVDVLYDLSGHPNNLMVSKKVPTPRCLTAWLCTWRYIIKFVLPYVFMILLGDAIRRDISWWNVAAIGPGKSISNGEFLRDYPESFVVVAAVLVGGLIACTIMCMVVSLRFQRYGKTATHRSLRWKEAIAAYNLKSLGIDLFSSTGLDSSELGLSSHCIENWSYNPANNKTSLASGSLYSTASGAHSQINSNTVASLLGIKSGIKYECSHLSIPDAKSSDLAITIESSGSFYNHHPRPPIPNQGSHKEEDGI